jgi:RecB family exonuclease
MSVTSLERIATCPLAWVFEHRANLRAGAMSSVATGPILNGNLGHRLIEELHLAGAFELSENVFLSRAADCLELLLRTEGATLLVPGASVERLQVTRQILRAARDLYRYLAQRGYRIAAVEEVVTTTSAVGPLHGRLDLRLVGADGHSAILDLKWGVSTPRSLLTQGRAVQLAVYARAVAERDGLSSLPRAGYFALSSGEILSTDPIMAPTRGESGPSLETSLRCVEATARNVIACHEAGRVLVTGTRRALPLLEALGVVKERHHQHFQAPPDAGCRYCGYGALCGKKWEAVA